MNASVAVLAESALSEWAKDFRAACKVKVFGGVSLGTLLLMFIAAAIVLLLPDLAHAQGQPAPWETGACRWAKAVTGRWIGWVAIIAVAIAAVMYGVGEMNQAFGTAMRIVVGFSLALAAAATVAYFWPGVVLPADCGQAAPMF